MSTLTAPLPLVDVLQRSARERTRGCQRPIRLAGATITLNTGTGEVINGYASADELDGVTYVRCGDRRAYRCESCSKEYKGDAWHLLSAGMTGGKTVPATVAEHPTLFVTLTAPSFGPVHGIRQKGPCRGRRDHPSCPHGRPLWCNRHHHPDDARLGEPLCADCYQYTAHVLWQWWAPELWRRTTIAIGRHLAERLGIPRSWLSDVAKVSYSKVAEFQARGVIHYHVVLRLDGPTGPGSVVGESITAQDLAHTLESAIRATTLVRTVTAGYRRNKPVSYRLGWGDQLDIQTVTAQAHRDHGTALIHPEMVAGYCAKYLVKSTEDFGIRGTIRTLEDLDHLNLRSHARNLILAAHRLSLAGADYQRLRDRYATLGYRGHPITKTRCYSTTFKALRHARRIYRQRPPGLDPDAEIRDFPADLEDPDDTGILVLKNWTYIGSGYLDTPTVRLAVASAVAAREH